MLDDDIDEFLTNKGKDLSPRKLRKQLKDEFKVISAYQRRKKAK